MGLSRMCIGETRKLIVPSDLAYKFEGAPPKIHPGATLVFEIEVIDIVSEAEEETLDYNLEDFWD
jgi:FKBP-type peptidyl-prolyl cis-trans isomerase